MFIDPITPKDAEGLRTKSSRSQGTIAVRPSTMSTGQSWIRKEGGERSCLDDLEPALVSALTFGQPASPPP